MMGITDNNYSLKSPSAKDAVTRGGVKQPKEKPNKPREPGNRSTRLAAKPHAFSGAVLSPKHARELTPSLCLGIASALAEQAYRKTAVPYTLWITEAWRVLGWAEPSAALFWEMATMYHTLYLAGRAHASDFQDSSQHSAPPGAIPPILSCGSTSSMGSGTTYQTHADRPIPSFDKKKFSTSASAKELPVWLVGTFLLLHCEETAYLRNLSGQGDGERRFYGTSTSPLLKNNPNGKVDFANLLNMSPRTRPHTEWNNDNSHCTAYLLRQLRKMLLLSAVSHNSDAVRGCMHLAAIPSPAPVPPSDRSDYSLSSATNPSATSYSIDEIRRRHDDEHGNVGLSVRLTMEDLERLHFCLQVPSGGGIDEANLKIGDFLWTNIFGSSPVPPTASIPIIDIEREIRKYLESDLLLSGNDHQEKKKKIVNPETENEVVAAAALANMSLESCDDPSDGERAKQPQQGYQKELSYTQLRGTTILLKPNTHEQATSSSVESATSGIGEPLSFAGPLSTASCRLHDLAVSGCSDAHMYLLQPFEHATIAGCSGCTIVVGSVAGLLRIVDCEKCTVTTAARRILICDSTDVRVCVFTPSPPLLVGDNRGCQLAPYNTYYDGLREDLLVTGLAAAVMAPESQSSPYHGGNGSSNQDTAAAWPPLQCASNKWKQPVELSKLEIPQVPNTTTQTSSTASGSNAATASSNIGVTSSSSSGGSPHGGSSPSSPSSPSLGADDKAVAGAGTSNETMHAPVLVPPSEFHILFVPLESDLSRQQRRCEDEQHRDENNNTQASLTEVSSNHSQYCRWLAEFLQLSPFRLPVEYERRALVMADRMKNIQQSVQKNLTEEQRRRFEEELNRGFRDWLVSSGNLRQVLDLVHLERRNSESERAGGTTKNL